MKHIAIIPVPATEREYVEWLQCDICHRTEIGDTWAKSTYDIAKVGVFLQVGENYPEYGSEETTSFDICPKCFIEKLVPFIEAFGSKAAVKKTEW
jgi:hypothetical protein